MRMIITPLFPRLLCSIGDISNRIAGAVRLARDCAAIALYRPDSSARGRRSRCSRWLPWRANIVERTMSTHSELQLLNALTRLCQDIAAIECRIGGSPAFLPFEIPAIDGRLADGGLRVDALHEVTAAGAKWGDDAAATLFSAGIAARQKGQVLWIVRRSDLFAPGLYQAGLPSDRLIHAEARDDNEMLAVMEDALRHRGLGAVIGEVRKASLTATRRLQLAAEGGTTLTLLMRRHTKLGQDPFSQPSSASTRWRIASTASAPLEVAGVGRPRWQVELVRQRGGAPFQLILEACDETGRCALAAKLADRPDSARRAETRGAA